jgi:hypothetical protein
MLTGEVRQAICGSRRIEKIGRHRRIKANPTDANPAPSRCNQQRLHIVAKLSDSLIAQFLATTVHKLDEVGLFIAKL